ncbi:QcrA and Rieske domain-containing protein [Mycolicibacterium palauense]|uniref:QcrA and Rieske domain-containing protein n=1 Tax=Mycolicibacterium palauense TaxID=2034511 RepID=UPI001FED20F3|nr:Rieske (2Fe-2S) protein [Mycolicibacterium palauense]
MTHRRELPASRREALLGAGAIGAAAAVAACGGRSSQPSAKESQPPVPVQVRAAKVPVGGGLVVQGAWVVVTQPRPAEFHAFSALCTHQGCLLSGVRDGVIECPCHGSRFNAASGAVEQGPATEPLPARTVTVDGEMLVVR